MRTFVAALVAAALLAACGSDPAPRAVPAERLAEAPGGNFVLYVSNQSFARPSVDVAVSIDGKWAVARRFDVEGQHTWVPFTFRIAEGSHELRATSSTGGAEMAELFETGPRNWAVLQYWCCDPSDGGPRFTFEVRDEPVAFG